jgi:hypothetical protein
LEKALASEFRQVLKIEQIRRIASLYGCKSSSKCQRKDAMLTSRCDKYADPDIVALVELDMQKMRLRIVLTRDAIRRRLRELERPSDHLAQRGGIETCAKESGP